MGDSADPLDSWLLAEVLRESYGAEADLYGQLYLLVRDNLLKFCERLATLKMDVSLFQVNAVDLPMQINQAKRKPLYDRIEVRKS